jgi:hypothetical protein
MDMPLLCAGFAALSVTFYVLLDGFDLGVGALLLLQPHEPSRDHMVDSITPTWDGNETWLIMTGVTLLAAFPIAYGILMPALYIPIIVMLLALGLRGVSFEFRAQMKPYRRRWDVIFAIGSLTAACMQGLILGAMIEGISVDGVAFSGSVFDCFRPFPWLCALCVLEGYVVLAPIQDVSAAARIFGTSVAHHIAALSSHVLYCSWHIIFHSAWHPDRMAGPSFTARNTELHAADCSSHSLLLYREASRHSSPGRGNGHDRCRDRWSCNPGVSDGCAISRFHLERVKLAAEPDLRPRWSNRCYSGGPRVLVLRLLGISWQDSEEGVGRRI